MKLEELLRHVADNIKNGKDLNHGLLYRGEVAPFTCQICCIDFEHPELYTLAPRMVRINGIEVKAGMSEAPKDGESVSTPRVGFLCGVQRIRYDHNNSEHVNMFKCGLLFPSTREGDEDAQAMAKAMLSFGGV